MFENVANIERLISEFEQSPASLTDNSFFDRIVKLRNLAISNWDFARPEDEETPELCQLRDRIVAIEQRILELAAHAPAQSIESVRLKLLLWILDQHISLEPGEQESTGDRLITSVLNDITLLSEHADEETTPHQRPVLKTVK